MPPKRKSRTATAAARVVPTRTLREFTNRISKTAVTDGGLSKKRKFADEEPAVALIEPPTKKALIVQDGDEDVIVQPVAPVRLAAPVAKSAPTAPKPTNKRAAATTPAWKRTKLDEFLASAKARAKLPPAQTEKQLQPQTKHADLPEHLATLVSLHAALLTALLLHKGQNQVGGILPAFANIRPHVERLSRRVLNLDDLRRIVWLSSYEGKDKKQADGGLRLVDYGRGKICIGFDDTDKRKLTLSDRLREDFAERARMWAVTAAPPAIVEEENVKVEEAVATVTAADTQDSPTTTAATTTTTTTLLFLIPLAPLQAHAHISTIKHVLHSKSAALLASLKARPSKPASSTTITTASSGKISKPQPAASRSSALLDRIRAKAAVVAATPAPTPEMLQRTAAEQRVPEVREVLRGYRARGDSMALRAVVDGIRGSAKNPIGHAEAELAVRVCAETEGWCEVVRSGTVEAVTFVKEIEKRFA